MMQLAVRRETNWVADQNRSVSSRFVSLATLAVVVFSVALPAIRVYYLTIAPPSVGAFNGRALFAVVVIACYMPLQLWLVLSAVRQPFGPAQRLALAVLAAVMLGMIPLVGVGWIGILYMLGTLLLAGLRPPWSLLLYGMLLLVPAPVSLALGQPAGAIYFTIGLLIFPVSLAVAIRLIRAARDLQDASLALAHQAILRERKRIDDEVDGALGIRLAAIADQGRRAEEMATKDSSAAASELKTMVDDARRTLAEARRLIMRYREVSVAGELNTITALLSAARIDAQVDVPAHLPDRIDEGDRELLRREVAHLLEVTAPGTAIAIAVTTAGDRLRVTMRSARSAGLSLQALE